MTQTRKEALTDLLAKVEAGECRQEEIARAAFDVQPALTPWRSVIGEAYSGSLDAAKALHEAVLPGWGYCDHLRRGMRYTVYIAESVVDESVDAVSNCPARAWLIAILKALIAQEPDQ